MQGAHTDRRGVLKLVVGKHQLMNKMLCKNWIFINPWFHVKKKLTQENWWNPGLGSQVCSPPFCSTSLSGRTIKEYLGKSGEIKRVPCVLQLYGVGIIGSFPPQAQRINGTEMSAITIHSYDICSQLYMNNLGLISSDITAAYLCYEHVGKNLSLWMLMNTLILAIYQKHMQSNWNTVHLLFSTKIIELHSQVWGLGELYH